MGLLFSCFALFIYLFVNLFVCMCIFVCIYCMCICMVWVCDCLYSCVRVCVYFQGNGNNDFLMRFQDLPLLPLSSCPPPSIFLSACVSFIVSVFSLKYLQKHTLVHLLSGWNSLFIQAAAQREGESCGKRGKTVSSLLKLLQFLF